VAVARGAGVEKQRLGGARLRGLAIRDVVQRGRVLAERDDVLVRRLRIVLPRRREEEQVQLELALGTSIWGEEGVAHGAVTDRGDAVGLVERRDLVRRLVHAQA